MDGAAGFTQCPIPPVASFVYDFAVAEDEHGTFWWHAHSHAQRADGLYGGLIVHDARPPPLSEAPAADVLLLVGDWFHRRQARVIDWYAGFGSLGNEPVPDSLLVNGRGRYDCSMAVPARPINCTGPRALEPLLASAPAGPTRLRVVNVGSVAGFSLAVDGGTLRPLTVDAACPVEAPPARSVGILYPGERTDVLLAWNAHAPPPAPRVAVFLDEE